MAAAMVSVWQQLRQNQEANAAAFRGARIEVPDVAVLRCPGCNFEESALFWTPVGDRGGRRLSLQCPVCNHGVARYDLRRNRGRSPVDGRRLVRLSLLATFVAVLSLTAFSRWAPPAQDLKFTLTRAWQQLAGVPAAAGDWIEQRLAALRDPTRTR